MRSSWPVPGRFAATALAVVLGLSVLGGAMPARAEGPNVAAIERRVLAAGIPLVVHRDPSAPTIAICVASRREAPASLVDAHSLGVLRATEEDLGRGPSLACLVVPPSELSFAVRAIRDRLTLASAASGQGAIPALRSLSLEGSVPPPREDASAIAVAGALPESWPTALSAELGQILEAPRAEIRPATLHQSTERLSVLAEDREAPSVTYTWAVPAGPPEDMASLLVGFDVLADATQGRFRKLLVGRGLARHVDGSIERSPGVMLPTLHVEGNSKVTLDRVRRFVDGALKQERLVGPSRGETNRAAARLRLRWYRAWEDVAERAALLACAELGTGDATHVADELNALSHVTPESVRRNMHDRIVDAHRTTVETYPKAWPEDDPARARHRVYTVAHGDTLDAVAQRFSVDPARLARENDLDPRYSLTEGQPLWIPSP